MKLRHSEFERIKRVLIIKLSSIGDVVHALPVSAALGAAYPHWKLTWIVEERSAPMVLGNPYLHEVIVLPDWFRSLRKAGAWRGTAYLNRLRRDLKSRRFDLALDLQGLSRSALLAWASGARHRYGYDWLREIAPLLVRRIPRRPESIHIVDQLLDVARHFGATAAPVEFPLHIPDEDDHAAVQLLSQARINPDQPFVAVNPTAGGNGHKGWDAQRLIELLRLLGREQATPVILVGGFEDQHLGRIIAEQTNPQPGNLIGRTSLKQLAAVLRRATLHVSGDTGSAHIAAALGTPVVSIFGRSNPDRLAPYGQRHRVIHHRELCHEACRQFHKSAPLNCSQGCLKAPPACMAAVNVDEVAGAVRRCLTETGMGQLHTAA